MRAALVVAHDRRPLRRLAIVYRGALVGCVLALVGCAGSLNRSASICETPQQLPTQAAHDLACPVADVRVVPFDLCMARTSDGQPTHRVLGCGREALYWCTSLGCSGRVVITGDPQRAPDTARPSPSTTR